MSLGDVTSRAKVLLRAYHLQPRGISWVAARDRNLTPPDEAMIIADTEQRRVGETNARLFHA